MHEAFNQPAQQAVCPLEELGVLAFRGPDARGFLQGQLSNDVTGVAGGALLRAGLHTPQGRTLAVLELLASGDNEILAVLPRELLALVSTTLRRYVLRSKVQISDESAVHRLYGLLPSDTAPDPAQARATAEGYPYEGKRRLLIRSATQSAPGGPTLPLGQWRAQNLAAGLPQLHAATSGLFVAQMLNLDCIGAISFQKGCYTGQEVIARAHYRGRVKRRMQRFISAAPLQLTPASSGQLTDGRGFRVVEAFAHPDGRCEFLAVAPLPGSVAAESDTEAGAAASTAIEATPLPLPYELPD